jgi:hypothetical protein
MTMAERKFKTIVISQDEKRVFCDKNIAPKDDKEAYIWFAVQTSEGVGYFFNDELDILVAMAERAGLADLVQRINQAD